MTETKTNGTTAEDTAAADALTDPSITTKYNTAAEITNSVLKKVIELCVMDAKILDICKQGDDLLLAETGKVYNKKGPKGNKISKGIAFPTSISPNHIVCHLSPIVQDASTQGMTLKDGDVVKVELGAHIDGYPAIVAHTLVVGASASNPVTGRKADVILAAWHAAEATLRLLRPGKENVEVTSTVSQIAEAYECKPVEGMLSYQMKQNIIDGEKQIILNPSEAQRKDHKTCTFEEGEVYCIDILASTGEGKPKAGQLRTTIYKKTSTTYQLKVQAARATLSEIQKKFDKFPFNIKYMEDLKKARMGLVETVKTGLVTPFEVFEEKPGEFVAQFLYTVLLLPSGPSKITQNPVDVSMIQSDKSIKNEEILKLLASNVKKPKKKKAANGAETKSPTSAE